MIAKKSIEALGERKQLPTNCHMPGKKWEPHLKEEKRTNLRYIWEGTAELMRPRIDGEEKKAV